MRVGKYKLLIERYCEINACEAKTLERHFWNLKEFVKFHRNKKFTRESVENFKRSLIRKGRFASSVNSAMSTLRILTRELRKEGIIPEDFSPSIKNLPVKPSTIVILDPAEIESLIECPRSWGPNRKTADRRKFDLAIKLITYCCYRRETLLSLKVENIDFYHGDIRAISKRSMITTHKLPEELAEELKEWVLERQAKPEDWLFPGKGGSHMGTSTLRDELRRRAKFLGISKKVNAQTLRKSMITNLYLVTRDAFGVQQFVGHKSIGSTLRYIQLAPKDLDHIIQKHPIVVYLKKKRLKKLKKLIKEPSLDSLEPEPS